MQRKAVLLFAVLAPACASQAREARATLPRSAAPPPLAVYTRDVHLPAQYQLENSATLSVDGGRVVVALSGVQGSEDVADPDRWTVRIIDENGVIFSPTARLDAAHERLAIEWGRGPVPTPCTADTIRPLHRLIPALDVYQGTAHYEFDYPGLASAATLTVVVKRPDGELRYGWRFAEGSTHVAHYGRTPADEQCSPLVVPGRVTRVAGTM